MNNMQKSNKKYYIYHIPGKKIGVTSDITKRVTITQGYKEGEYEILDVSEDIDYVSEKEIKLQRIYGYKIDPCLYKQSVKINKMNLNVTEQTTTFPCPVNKLKGRLSDVIGLRWSTDFGEVELTKGLAKWITKNAYPSQFNNERCFIYNKALYEKMSNKKEIPTSITKFDLIRDWASDKGIYDKGDSKTQYIKLMEEAGELAQGLLKDDKFEVADAIGDMVVVLTNLAALEGLLIEDCINLAYDEIKNRKGKMENGTFVKQTQLNGTL